MKYNTISKNCYTLAAIAGILTPLWIYLAYMERGYFAIGGEWTVWLVPLIIAAATDGRINGNQ